MTSASPAETVPMPSRSRSGPQDAAAILRGEAGTIVTPNGEYDGVAGSAVAASAAGRSLLTWASHEFQAALRHSRPPATGIKDPSGRALRQPSSRGRLETSEHGRAWRPRACGTGGGTVMSTWTGLRARVVFESMFGNTEEVARAVAEGLRLEGVDATVADVRDASHAGDHDLLVVGAPMDAFSLSRASTRQDAVKQGPLPRRTPPVCVRGSTRCRARQTGNPTGGGVRHAGAQSDASAFRRVAEGRPPADQEGLRPGGAAPRLPRGGRGGSAERGASSRKRRRGAARSPSRPRTGSPPPRVG